MRRQRLREIPEYASTYAKFYRRRFIEHLIEAEVATAPEPPAKKSTALGRLREEYESYLRKQRGLAESTIDNCTGYMERFLAFRFGDTLGALNAIIPDDIVAFLGKLKPGWRPFRYTKHRPPKTLRGCAVQLAATQSAFRRLPRKTCRLSYGIRGA